MAGDGCYPITAIQRQIDLAAQVAVTAKSPGRLAEKGPDKIRTVGAFPGMAGAGAARNVDAFKEKHPRRARIRFDFSLFIGGFVSQAVAVPLRIAAAAARR